MHKLLEARKVFKSFGGRDAVRDVSFSLAPGEMLGIIGPNGAGKTTLLNLLTGFYPPDRGELLIDGVSIAGLSPDQITRMGVMRTFQLTRIFSSLTVFENMLLSASIAGLGKEQAAEHCGKILCLLGLEPVAEHRGEEISGGQAKLLEIGSCLAARPRVLLLDEPFAAVHPHIKEVLSKAILEENGKGQSFIIVSHDIQALAKVCPQTLVMNAGEVITKDEIGIILKDEELIETYLGGFSG